MQGLILLEIKHNMNILTNSDSKYIKKTWKTHLLIHNLRGAEQWNGTEITGLESKK